MWAVDPVDIDVSQIATDSAAKIRDKRLARRLRSARTGLEDNHVRFHNDVVGMNSHSISAGRYILDDITEDQLRWVYKQHMAKPTGGARAAYDALVAAARYELCSYCQYGQATTLDHYVPKGSVGGLAIEPLNLVPSCAQCNHKLSDYAPTTRSEMLFHPYYESVEARWLFASVHESAPVAVNFYVELQGRADAQTAERVENQFVTLGLGLMYAAISARDIAEAKSAMVGQIGCSGDVIDDYRVTAAHSPSTVSQLLLETSDIAFAVDRNSRRGVVYEALAGSEWFCRVGFRT
jgi:5-methylcytosine-specific restriction endonuclease McrA